MADVLFRYLLAAREHDRAWYKRAFLVDERRLAASLERVIETAALRIEVLSQHERVSEAFVKVPASKAGDLVFVDEPQPHPPSPGEFETRTERIPLAATFAQITCDGCHGAGIIDCSCGGSGRVPCEHCGGSGTTYAGQGRCMECMGQGVEPCQRCRGRGMFKHQECDGEGRVATWQEEVHTYSVKRLRDALLPPDAPTRAVATAADEWLAHNEEFLPELTAESLETSLGYSTPDLALMLRAATRVEASFLEKAHAETEHCLFTKTRVQCVPVSACVLRSERSGRADRFWLVGRGEHAVEIRPAPRVDAWKAAGWPGLLAGVSAASSLAGVALGLPWLGPEWMTAGALLGLGALSAAGLPAAGVGLKRFAVGSGAPVRTIAVIPCSGEPTMYVNCLAALGSYVNRVEVLDRGFKAMLEAMMGARRPPHQSQTVVLRTHRGDLVRLIEITQAQRLSRPELARMMEAVSGILFLESPGHLADELRSQMHAATTARPPETRVSVEPDQPQGDENGLGPGGGVALEAVRRVWTRTEDRKMDWPAVFERLWSPVDMALSGLRPPWRRRMSRRALHALRGAHR